MAESDELVGRLRAWSRRFEVYSHERRIMLEAAAEIERLSAAAPPVQVPPQNGITPEVVEAAMGGRKLLKWQVDALGGR